MRDFLTPLLELQRFFLPVLFVLLVWAVWRTVFRRDLAVGLGLYLGLVVIVDGFYNTGIYVPGLEMGSIRYSEVCALFLLLMNRPAAPTNHSPRRIVYFLVGLYFTLMFVAALRADPILAGIFDFRRVIAPQIVAFWVAHRGLGTLADYRRFFLCLTGLALIVGVFNFWDIFFDRWILHSDMLYKPEYWHTRRLGRFGSILLNPNYLGAFVVLVFPSVFVWAMSERDRWLRLYLWAGLLALAFCLVKTQSRGPILAFGISLVLLAFGPIGDLSRARRLGTLALLIGVFAFFMPGFFETAVERFDTLDQESSTEDRSRYTTWQYTRRIIADHPLGGIGLGEQQFLNAMAKTDFQERYEVKSLDNPHNSYLQAAVYAGLPAVVAFILANLVLLAKGSRIAAKAFAKDRGLARATFQGSSTPAIFGLTVGITGFLACIYPDMHLFTQNVAPVYWVFLGLLLALTTGASPIRGKPGSDQSRTRDRSAGRPIGADLVSSAGDRSAS